MAHSTPVFALVDCNNFFVSCERLFRPDLTDKPVAVLSNNDGCIVARSNEVKRLGVPMAVPHFKVKSLLEANQVTLFSANFSLYGDMSQRVTAVLRRFSPHMEIYSVDESFLQIDDLNIADYQGWAEGVAAAIKREVGIPVSVGVGPTKTLAKVATEVAKERERPGLSLFNQPELTRGALEGLPVGKVWGIGWRSAPRLRGYGIATAADLIAVSDDWALDQLTIRGLRTVKELRGEPCLRLEEVELEHEQKSISATRSFGHTVRALNELEAAVANFAARTAAKLRRRHQLATRVSVYIRTGKHAERPLYLSTEVRLPFPSADTANLIRGALAALHQIYDPDFAYQKAGVVLTDLVPQAAQQLPLLEAASIENLQGRDRLMQAVDRVNNRYGSQALRMAVQASGQNWYSKRQRLSPAYTSSWHQLPRVYAKS